MSDSENTAAPPQHARVCIVGGGIMGCALAYHLAKEGWTDVVLLEKAELTSGSTWHAAGQITYSTSHYGFAKCAAYGIQQYHSIESETGQSVTFHDCGSLRMAYNDDEFDYLLQIESVCKGLGLESQILSPPEIKKEHPFYNLDGIRAALHTPHDGHLDPAGAALAHAKGARQMGVTIVRHCRATGIEQQTNGEWLVKTERGDVLCEHVVNAGGMYARQIAAWNGYDLPTVSMKHHYLITERVPEYEALEKELPVVRDDRNISGYARMEQKSGLIGIYEKNNADTVWDDGAPWQAENELFEPELERIMPWPETALQRLPVLQKVGIRRIVHGAISHPPDGNPLVGPAPGLQNYWCFCGCQIGIGWGPGLARELARWMTQGASDISMRDLDPRRFGKYADRNYQETKGKEDYMMRHEIPYPHFCRTAAREQRLSPLHEKLKAKGAVHEEICGWERPRWFARDGVAAVDVYSFRHTIVDKIVAAEVRAVREKAGVIDISAFSKVELSGEGAADVLTELTANKIPKEGRVSLAHFLSHNGRMELEATAAHLSGGVFYIGCAPFLERRLLDLLSYAAQKNGGAKVTNRTDEWAAIALNGPLSAEILAQCADDALDIKSFPWLSAREMTIAGNKLLALRLSFAGECGWELHGSRDGVAAAYDAIDKAGAQHGIVDYGTFAMDSLRMEKMFPGAHELTNEVYINEAGLSRFARADKKDAAPPPRWHCVYLRVEDGANNSDGAGSEAVFANGKRVGVVTSIARGHYVNKLLAFAYVDVGMAKPGTMLEVCVLNEWRKAEVLEHPLYDPDNKKPRA